MSTPIARRTLIAATVATVMAAAIVPFAVSRADTLASVDVYDRTADEALPVYRHHGRKYVAGQPGNEYAVRIRNCTGQRLLAVLSVDGVNAITGETASTNQSGYVIEPYGYVTVEGWRKDLNRSAAFYFSDPSDSYAARTGRPNEPLYVICLSGGRGQIACEKLTAAGLNVVNIEGGTSAWAAADLPIIRGKKSISLERQVRIAAGSLVLLGCVLGFLIHPLGYVLSAFIGAGLVFAGVTNTCGMGMLLARMPWNRVSETCS